MARAEDKLFNNFKKEDFKKCTNCKQETFSCLCIKKKVITGLSFIKRKGKKITIVKGTLYREDLPLITKGMDTGGVYKEGNFEIRGHWQPSKLKKFFANQCHYKISI